jgi:hypothetical protein
VCVILVQYEEKCVHFRLNLGKSCERVCVCVILVQYEEKCVHFILKLYFYKNITIAFYPFQIKVVRILNAKTLTCIYAHIICKHTIHHVNDPKALDV